MIGLFYPSTNKFEVYNPGLGSYALFVYQLISGAKFIHLTDKLIFVITFDRQKNTSHVYVISNLIAGTRSSHCRFFFFHDFFAPFLIRKKKVFLNIKENLSCKSLHLLEKEFWDVSLHFKMVKILLLRMSRWMVFLFGPTLVFMNVVKKYSPPFLLSSYSPSSPINWVNYYRDLRNLYFWIY